MAVDILGVRFGVGVLSDKQKFLAFTQEARVGVAPVLLVKPKTYMNLSGDSVRKVVDFYKLDPKRQVLIMSDDIDLPLGELRLRMKGGPGTHNGLKSIIEIYGEEIPRLRIGIGQQPSGEDLSNWVLSKFSDEERIAIAKASEGLSEMVQTFVMEESVDK